MQEKLEKYAPWGLTFRKDHEMARLLLRFSCVKTNKNQAYVYHETSISWK